MIEVTARRRVDLRPYGLEMNALSA